MSILADMPPRSVFKAWIIAITASAIVTTAAILPVSADDAGVDAIVLVDAPASTTTTTITTTTGPSGSAAPAPDASSPKVAPPSQPALERDPQSIVGDIYLGITTKDWFLVAGGVLALITLGARGLLLKKWPKFERDRWGVMLAAAMSGITAISVAWGAAEPIASERTWMGALKLFAAAVFAYVTAKKLIAPGAPSAPADPPIVAVIVPSDQAITDPLLTPGSAQ